MKKEERQRTSVQANVLRIESKRQAVKINSIHVGKVDINGANTPVERDLRFRQKGR
jgi:hypothetical protein